MRMFTWWFTLVRLSFSQCGVFANACTMKPNCTCCSMSPSPSSSTPATEAGGLRMDTSSSWRSCWHKLSCKCWFRWQLVHNVLEHVTSNYLCALWMLNKWMMKSFNQYLLTNWLPAGNPWRTPGDQERTVEDRARRLPAAEWAAPRAASDGPGCRLPACPAGLRQESLQESCSRPALYTPAQNMDGFSAPTVRNVSPLCLTGEMLSWYPIWRNKRFVKNNSYGKNEGPVYLNKLLQEQTGKMWMVSCRSELTHNSPKKTTKGSNKIQK